MKDLIEIASSLPPARLRAVGRAMAKRSIAAHDAGDAAAAAFWHDLGHSLLDVAEIDYLAELLAEADTGAILEEGDDGMLELEGWVIDSTPDAGL